MNVVVLAGGLSTERDVSFKSGDMIASALRQNGHKTILIDVFMGYSDKEEDLDGIFERSKEISLRVDNIPTEAPDILAVKRSRKDKSDNFFGPNVIRMCQMADIVFIALHGENGEDGRIQAAFDLLGIKYTGNGYISSAIAMDKGMTKEFLRGYDVPFPGGFSIKKHERFAESFTDAPRFPCVVKPSCGGSSIGVSIVNNAMEYEYALDEAFRWENEVVVEDYIEGREFSVGVIEGVALPVIEIVPKEGFYDYKNKYAKGAADEICPANISDEISSTMQLYAERVAAALGIETYSRMDFMLDKDNNIFCLEANTLPGMTPTSLLPQEAACIGIGYADLCEEIIKISLRRNKR
ncbi:MAG: D-alanine--D-alanine ligase [Lachnospiraceae bacterium]|nr:D-alanine--D-alanine ligase [Lachnospiraceae bacterium]